MSYILEALKKAERERSLGQVPNLGTMPSLPLPPQRHFWPWLLALALLANAAVLVMVFFFPEGNTGIAQPPASTPPVKQSESQRLEKKAAKFALETPPSAQPLKETKRLQEPKPFLVKTPKPAANASSAPNELPPLLQAMPAEFSRSIPALNIDVHVYSKIPSKRFVLVNSTRYREGDQLRDGPLLEAIAPDGIILRHRGQRFLLLVHR